MRRTARALCALLATVMLTGAACGASGEADPKDGGVKVDGKVDTDTKDGY
jgi:hypothetical protein